MTYVASIVQAWQRQIHDAPAAGTVMVDAADLAAVCNAAEFDAHGVSAPTSHVCIDGECRIYQGGALIHTIPLDADFRLQQAKAERG